MTDSPTPPEILKLPEVAKYLRLSRSQAYAKAQRGEIPCFYVGTSPRVRRCDLEKWIETRIGQGPLQ